MMYPPAAATSARVALADEQRLISYAALGPLLAAEQAWLRQSGGSRFALLADNGCGWAAD